jgi:hypothetical protein
MTFLKGSTHKWGHIAFVFLTCSSVKSSSSTYNIKKFRLPSRRDCIEFYCVCHVFFIFLCWWIRRSIPCLGYCESCCNEHGVWMSFDRLNLLPLHIYQYRIARSYSNSIFSFLRSHQNVFQDDCTNLYSHLQCTGPAFVVSAILDNSHSAIMLTFHCGFNSYFSGSKRCWALPLYL